MKKILSLLVLFVLATVSSNADDWIPVTSIRLDKTKVTMETGSELTLKATVLPENASDPSLGWRSSDKSICTAINGKLQAIKVGTVTITPLPSEDEVSDYDVCIVTVVAKGTGTDVKKEISGQSIYTETNTLFINGYEGYQFDLIHTGGQTVKSFTVKTNADSFELNVPRGIYILRGIGTQKSYSQKVIIK